MILASLAWALAGEPMRPGASVIVRSGARIQFPGGEATPVIEHVGFGAYVIRDDGGEVLVRPGDRGCVSVLTAAREIDVAVLVRKADLLPQVSSPISGTLPSGHAWSVTVGAPVVATDETTATVNLARGVSVVLPRAEVPTALSVDRPIPVGGPTSRRLDPVDGVLGHFGPQAIRYGTAYVDPAGERVRWPARCGTIELTPAAPPRELDDSLAGVLGSRGAGLGSPSLPAGTSLVWTDGTLAGSLLRRVPVARFTSLQEGRRCGTWRLADNAAAVGAPTLAVCATEESITTVPDRGPLDVPAGRPPPMTVSVDGRVIAQEPEVTGTVDALAVARHLTSRRSALDYCYRRVLAGKPTVVGTVEVTFALEPGGTLSDLRATGDPGTHAVGECLVRTLGARPGPTGGKGTVKVSFLLKPPPAP